MAVAIVALLTSSPPQAARIPTEPDLSLVSSAGSSHSRLTSAEDNVEALLLGYPPIGLVDKRNIEQSEEKKRGPYILALEVRGFTARIVSEVQSSLDQLARLHAQRALAHVVGNKVRAAEI